MTWILMSGLKEDYADTEGLPCITLFVSILFIMTLWGWGYWCCWIKIRPWARELFLWHSLTALTCGQKTKQQQYKEWNFPRLYRLPFIAVSNPFINLIRAVSPACSRHLAASHSCCPPPTRSYNYCLMLNKAESTYLLLVQSTFESFNGLTQENVAPLWQTTLMWALV